MGKSYLLYKVTAVALLSAALYSCKKPPAVDNANEIVTPYTVYFSDSFGVLYNTNTGDLTKYLTFHADGYQSRSLLVVDSNVLWLKNRLFYSVNGSLFNPTYGVTGSQATNPASYNQSMMIYAKDQNRVYVASLEGHGVVYSEKSGNPGTWNVDDKWDGNITDLGLVKIASMTQLDNGQIVGYDPVLNRTFAKNSSGDNWVETTNSDPNQQLPTTGSWTMWHAANMVIAIDNTPNNGIYTSTNNGNGWTHSNSISGGFKVFYVAQLYSQAVLVGTEKGVYRLSGNDFVPSNGGVQNGSHVRGFVSKELQYKNAEKRQYIYMTANTGLYRSEDIGHNWIKVKDGNFVNIW